MDIANEAKNIAERVATQLAEREKLHDERHAILQKDITDLSSTVKSIGAVLISLILSVLGWSLAQQYNANEAQKMALSAQIAELRENNERFGGSIEPNVPRLSPVEPLNRPSQND